MVWFMDRSFFVKVDEFSFELVDSLWLFFSAVTRYLFSARSMSAFDCENEWLCPFKHSLVPRLLTGDFLANPASNLTDP